LTPARIVQRRALTYPDGARPAEDRSAHVRAASGLAWLRDGGEPRLVIAQDDTSFLAVLDEAGAVRTSVRLDHQVAGRRIFESRLGNKKHKLDLEAATTLPDGRVLVVGSGSLPARERVVISDGSSARVAALPALYAALRAERGFSGSELNVEGAAVLGDTLVLANRGNGAPDAAGPPVDAVAMLPLASFLAHVEGGPAPAIERVMALALGEIGGVRLTLTDLCARRDQLYFLASAEASPNAIDDGVVVGTAVGRIAGANVRWVPIVDESGAPSTAKTEGLAWASPTGEGSRVLAVVDRDDPDAASELLTLELPVELVSPS
jgi:hypothetical protein